MELEDGRRRCLVGTLWALPSNPVGEPDAGNPHVRFDEREVETGLAKRHRKLVTHWAGDHSERFHPATALPLDSTRIFSSKRVRGIEPP